MLFIMFLVIATTISLLIGYLVYKNGIKCSQCRNLDNNRYCSVQSAYISEPSVSNCWSSIKR